MIVFTGKRGRGRPPQGERVDIRIPADLLKRIDRDAKHANASRAEMIRRVIAVYYDLVDGATRA